jgi:hypothetical protein
MGHRPSFETQRGFTGRFRPPAGRFRLFIISSICRRYRSVTTLRRNFMLAVSVPFSAENSSATSRTFSAFEPSQISFRSSTMP